MSPTGRDIKLPVAKDRGDSPRWTPQNGPLIDVMKPAPFVHLANRQGLGPDGAQIGIEFVRGSPQSLTAGPAVVVSPRLIELLSGLMAHTTPTVIARRLTV